MRAASLLLLTVLATVNVPARFEAASTTAQGNGHPVFDAPGFQDDRSYHSPLPFEYIDPFTGSLMLRFVEFQLPGNNGLDLVIERVYNSKGGPGNGGFWEVAPAGFPLRVLPAGPGSQDLGYRFLMPDGGTKVTSGPQSGGYYYTDQFWRYNATNETLDLPNGLTVEYGYYAGSPIADARYIRTVFDAFGNKLDYWWDWVGGVLKPIFVDQTLAGSGQVRRVIFHWNASTGLLDAAEFNGRIWHYEYVAQPNDIPRLTVARPPVGPTWKFSYTDKELRKVTLPSGGEVNYQWTWHPFPGDAESDGQSVYSIALRRRTYSGRNVPTPAPWELTYPTQGRQSTILTPCREVVETHNAFRLEQRIVRDDAGEAERELRAYKPIPIGNVVHHALEQRTILRDGQTHVTDLTYSGANYDDYGKPSLIVERNGASTRTTTYQYQHGFGRYLKGKVTSEQLEVSGEGGGQAFTRTASYNYQTGFMEQFNQYGIVTSYAAHASGNVGTVTDSHGHQTNFGYSWGQVSSIQTPEYAVSRSINSDGSLASETRRGLTTSYQYDAGGRESVRTPPDGNPIYTSYDDVDGQAVHTQRGGNVQHQYLDGFGRPYVMDDAAGNRVHLFYDGCGRKDYESYPYPASQNLGPGTDYDYDALGRVVKKANGDGSYVTYTYAGGVTTIRDELQRNTYQTWLSYGDPDDARLVQVVDGENHTTSYLYNALGSLLRVNQPQGITRTWVYNSANQLQSETHPESGTVTFGYNGDLLSSRTDFRGQTTFTYDGNHRLELIDRPGNYHDVEMDHDESDNRTKLRNSFVHSDFLYDNANRLTQRNDYLASRSFVTQLSYDGNDNVRWIKYPSGREISQDVDAADRLSAVRIGSTVLASGFQYHSSGAVTSYTAGNGIVHTTTFDARHRPATVSSQHFGATYGYDTVGNVTSVTDVRPGFSQVQLTYDGVDRLRTVNGFGQNVYTYDAVGNRLTKQGPVNYSYNSANRLHQTTGQENATFSYDPAGNTLGDGTMTFTYTPDNMMETATGPNGAATYWYDGDNVRRYRQVPGGATFVTIGATGLNTLSEFRLVGSDTVLERDYIYAGSRLLFSTSLAPGSSAPPPPPFPGPPPTFTDDPIAAGQTVVKAVHVTELRAAIDARRVHYGLSPYSWVNPTITPQSTLISFAHVFQMRAAIVEFYQAAGLTPPTFTDPVLQPTVTPVKAVHFAELRAAVGGIGSGPGTASSIYYHLDPLGSVRAVSDQAGQLVRRHDYLPFGEEYAAPPLMGDAHRFVGKPRDVETGLDYFGARYRAVSANRFLQVDPLSNVIAATVDPQRWNRYEYAKGNPYRYFDPDGRDLTLFYRPPDKSKLTDFGHVFVYVKNDVTGEAAYLDFYPGNDGRSQIGRITQERVGQHASVTISLTAEQESAALALIASKKSRVPDYSILGSTCVSQCKDVFGEVGLRAPGAITPTALWMRALRIADIRRADAVEAALDPRMGKEYARGRRNHVFDPKALMNLGFFGRAR